ncbi:MAG: hypothetical protein ABSF16_05315 [Terracidiphilus sp.]|jgi:hypothetical protein
MEFSSITRREFVRLSAGTVAAGTLLDPLAQAAWRRPKNSRPASLPFSVTVAEEKIGKLPDYMSKNNPNYMDFPYCPVLIDGEYWVMYKNGYNSPVFRYKGTNIENAVRQEDGSAALPKGAYILGGVWYNGAEKKLYAPLHYEVEHYLKIVFREIHLATSTDKGMTWKYEGPLLTTLDPKGPPRKRSDSSGVNFDGGDGDQMLYVDERSGYFYLFTSHYVQTKDASQAPAFLRHRVARCPIADKMAPGKWQKFYNGAWSEPGIAGKASYINGYCVTYNSYLKKYLSLNGLSGVSICDDLSKQDWSPSIHLGDYWGSNDIWGYWATDDKMRDVYHSGKELFVYSFWMQVPGRRFHISLDRGETGPDHGYTSPSVCMTAPNGATMDPGQLYGYNAFPESSDPIEARKTLAVGSSSEKVNYAGNWSDVTAPSYYQGKAKSSAQSGASVEFAFRGKDIYWRAVRGPNQGKADVFLDGVLEATVDCSAMLPTVFQYAFIKRGLNGNSPHAIKVVVKNERGHLSTGTSITHMVFEESAENG